jgi:hypothetical protein
MTHPLTNGAEWKANGVYHRAGDLPARVFDNGRLEWWFEGKLHRDHDKPAIITETGNKLYYKNGLHHRDGDGPSGEYMDGDMTWHKNGKLHRDAVDESGDPLPAFAGQEWSTWFIEGRVKNTKYPWVSRLKDGTKGYYIESDSCILFDNGLKMILDDEHYVISKMRVFMDEKTDIEPFKCSICMENKRNTLFNCGHLCSCRACSENLQTCPVCRADVKTRTNVYL